MYGYSYRNKLGQKVISFTSLGLFKIFAFQVMFFEKIIEIGPILSCKLCSLAHIPFTDFEKVDEIAFS